MNGSRERVLGRIRAALADVPAGEAPPDVSVPQTYAASHEQGERLELLAGRIADYRAEVHRTTGGGLPDTIAAVLSQRRTRRAVTASDAPPVWFTSTAAEVVRDDGVDVATLEGTDSVVTGCALAVAETGTLVLDSGAAQGRRIISLIPDHHVCVVNASDVVASVPHALHRLDPDRPLTWISGPSATSDIELERVEGVHGPRVLDVVLVE
ncbi:L-lactate dehydrogenase complex protein LldG [Haloactinospora alba]|uniref:L-lactate dehydrogenase complex protein LldG n=1 Tax=Haloactinospora alba TaxID=405555 RepID=A0A543NIS6_9ACTN|nr:lactate utilization protein C [Haloactinospora alba]TQN31751.1 L-lactate dehydrogenase complex protein LldG [Haloactinospora alba]